MPYIPHPGPLNALTDVPGLTVGHHTHPNGLTGTTVVLTGEGAVGGVDVRGAAPGTRETDLLDPSNLVSRVQAVVLSGGSAYGLAAADGVMQFLEERGLGHPIGQGRVVPIVPAAVLFDLGRSDDWRQRPTAEFGYLAAQAATSGPIAQGCVGAGAGARAGGLKGGIGTASVVLDHGLVVGALVGLNAVGRAHNPMTGGLYGAYLELAGEFQGLRLPSDYEGEPEDYLSFLAQSGPGRNTIIGVVATNATLDKAQARRLAQMTHDGIARAVRPAHTLFDGDTLFALATARQPAPDPVTLNMLGAAAADCFARAIVHAMLQADSRGGLTCYREAFPGACP